MIPHYEARAATHAARRDAERRVSTRIARLRLATFIPGAASLVWAFAGEVDLTLTAIGTGLLLAFAVLVVWHARVDERVSWHDALFTVNQQSLARIARAWDRLPPADPPLVSQLLPFFTASVLAPASADPRVAEPRQDERNELEHHPYAFDLDLFGRASLMQWLGPAATAAGTATLQWWLLHAASPSEVGARQQAVQALAGSLDWREQFAAHGRLVAGVRHEELVLFLRWAESPGALHPSRSGPLRAAVMTIACAIWCLIALHGLGVTTAALWLIPVAAGMVLSFATAGIVHGEFTRAGAGQHAFARYAELFAHATRAPLEAGVLQDIHVRLSASGSSAPECMRALNRIIGLAHLRSGAGIFHFLVQAFTLWDFHVFFALDRWRRRAGPAVREWMRAVGELDALSALARVRADNPEWCLPQIIAGPADQRIVAATQLGHPLIHDERRVGNDVEIGPPGTLVLITGSNMSGKSTLLRAVGQNVVLAQAGAPVCAASMRMPPADLETSIRVQDSLEHGLSYFMAALARLKGVVARSQHARDGRTVVYLLDEVLQGTNTVERAIAVRGVARHLLEAGAIGAMSSHDLGLAAEEPFRSRARLVHFSDTVDAHGAMSFDYRLRPGLATSRNALRLMHLIGIDVDDGEQMHGGKLRPGERTRAWPEAETEPG
jgi:hypothetical protein